MEGHHSSTSNFQNGPAGDRNQDGQAPIPEYLADYDLTRAIQPLRGMRQGLPNYGDPHFALFLRKAFIKALGYSEDALSRPIIGIVNTFSAFNPCHANVPQLVEAAKRGVQLNGGLAMEFPTISIHESFSSPTSMFLRNLMSMDTEEMIKAQPLDACIVIGGELSPALPYGVRTRDSSCRLGGRSCWCPVLTTKQDVTRQCLLSSWAESRLERRSCLSSLVP